VNDLASMAMLAAQDTHWEAMLCQLERVVLLRESLVSLLEIPAILDIAAHVTNFLAPSYFERLAGYIRILTQLNDVSLLYQTQRFLTGCLVPLCIAYLASAFSTTGMEVRILPS
jgi:hypothetical protein